MQTCLLLLLFSSLVLAQNSDFLGQYCACNGFNSVSLLLPSQHQKEIQVKRVMKSLEEKSVRSRIGLIKNVSIKEGWMKDNFIVLLPNMDQGWWDTAEGAIAKSLLEHSLIQNSLVINLAENSTMILPKFGNVLFQVYHRNEFYQVISIGHDTQRTFKMRLHTFNGNFKCWREHWDLANMTLKSTALDFGHEISLSNCDNVTNVCRATGTSWQVMMAISILINVDVQAHVDPDQKWGYERLEGNDSYIGVMGSLIEGHRHIGLAFWFVSSEREEVVDCPVLGAFQHVMMYLPRASVVDSSFLARPFTKFAWIGAFIVVSLLHVALIIFDKLSKEDEQKMISTVATSKECLVITLGICWAALLAVYGGALAMFASSQEELPFNTIGQAVRAYPEWKVITLPGMEDSLRVYTMADDPRTGSMMVQRLQTSPESVIVEDVAHGMAEVARDRFVLFAPTNSIENFLQEQGQPDTLRTIKVGSYPASLILRDNSPLRPAIQWAMLRLWESQGDLIRPSNSRRRINREEIELLSANPVELGHVLPAIYILAAAAGFAGLVLLVELLAKKRIRIRLYFLR